MGRQAARLKLFGDLRFLQWDQNYGLLGCDTVYIGRWVGTFQRNLLHPSSGLKTMAAGSSKTMGLVYDTA
jgi:hypothetical protein